MVGTRGGTVTKPNAESYGRMHRASQKHSNLKKKIAANSSGRKITRKVEGLLSTPPDLKKVRDEEKTRSNKAPSADETRTTRNDPLGPRCFHYGRYRETIYKGQDYFFSFIFPTTKKKLSYYETKKDTSPAFNTRDRKRKAEKLSCESCGKKAKQTNESITADTLSPDENETARRLNFTPGVSNDTSTPPNPTPVVEAPVVEAPTLTKEEIQLLKMSMLKQEIIRLKKRLETCSLRLRFAKIRT
uniref:Uncharacterized protein n=1 Tax=Attheya septentrionalis TaxID=420275 RepID=A0A7S2U8A9_9STRA|mmetsp:Transcript_14158/g.25659  ORF Transcript_14158/g.25659 Transcript_14158/m.25659 type:complete len:244 (+) Transcript_14158:97-828(+)